MMSEQRKDPRLSLWLNLTYKIAGTGKSGKSITHDISASGIRFFAEHPLEPGTRLEVTLRLPEGDQAIGFVGEVVWSRAAASTATERSVTGGVKEVGVRFVEIQPKDQRVLKQYAMLYLPPGSV